MQLDSTVGSYAFSKKSGADLREQLLADFPSGSSNLPPAISARRYNVVAHEQIDKTGQTQTSSCYRKFANVVSDETTERLKTLYLQMKLKGLKYSKKFLDHNRSSTTQALHLGRWQKYSNKPQITPETVDQNEEVSILLKEFLTIISVDIAPRIAKLYELYYPNEWKTQLMYVSFVCICSGFFSIFC